MRPYQNWWERLNYSLVGYPKSISGYCIQGVHSSYSSNTLFYILICRVTNCNLLTYICTGQCSEYHVIKFNRFILRNLTLLINFFIIFYLIKFVSHLWQVGGFLHQENWPPRYSWNIVEGGVKHHNLTRFIFISFRLVVIPLFVRKGTKMCVVIILDFFSHKKLFHVNWLVDNYSL